MLPEDARNRPEFEKLTPIFPNVRFDLEADPGDFIHPNDQISLPPLDVVSADDRLLHPKPVKPPSLDR